MLSLKLTCTYSCICKVRTIFFIWGMFYTLVLKSLIRPSQIPEPNANPLLVYTCWYVWLLPKECLLKKITLWFSLFFLDAFCWSFKVQRNHFAKKLLCGVIRWESLVYLQHVVSVTVISSAHIKGNSIFGKMLILWEIHGKK